MLEGASEPLSARAPLATCCWTRTRWARFYTSWRAGPGAWWTCRRRGSRSCCPRPRAVRPRRCPRRRHRCGRRRPSSPRRSCRRRTIHRPGRSRSRLRRRRRYLLRTRGRCLCPLAPPSFLPGPKPRLRSSPNPLQSHRCCQSRARRLRARNPGRCQIRCFSIRIPR